MPMISVENISKEFKIKKKDKGLKGAFKGIFSNDFEIKKAVSDISFNINEGEIVGYIGSNGAGKSTTIKMMTGILTPSSGKVTVNGLIPYKEREKNAKDIGVVFGQRTQLWWDIPLYETFTILKTIYEIDDEKFKENMEFLDQVLDLKDFINKPVRMLSLGQRMRADFAASLIHGPKILYLDEPTIGLDVMVKEKVRAAIKKINKRDKTTIILTTHDLTDIEELCNRIIIIDKGTKIYDGTLEELKNKFGYMTDLKVKLKEKINEPLCIYKMFDLNENDITEEINGLELTISFNKNKLTVSDIIGKIIDKIKILDFSISERDLEYIIKKIYTEGV